METRVITNLNGDPVVTISLPEGTPQRVWDEKIAGYKELQYVENLDLLKQRKAQLFEKETWAFANAHYSLESRDFLILLRGDALTLGMMNRFNYINQLLVWMNSLTEYNFLVLTQIYTASNADELNAITWNFDANIPADPNVNLADALAITD